MTKNLTFPRLWSELVNARGLIANTTAAHLQSFKLYRSHITMRLLSLLFFALFVLFQYVEGQAESTALTPVPSATVDNLLPGVTLPPVAEMRGQIDHYSGKTTM